MKKTIYLLAFSLTALIIGVTVSHASFPVKKTVETEKVSDDNQSIEDRAELMKLAQESIDNQELNAPDGVKENSGLAMDEEKLITLLLWFFLGALAAHRWYAGKPVGWNILFILTGGGCVVWAVVDLINILQDNF